MTIMMANNAAQPAQNRNVRSRSRARAGADSVRPAGSRPVRGTRYGVRSGTGVSSAPHPVRTPVADQLSAPHLVAAGLLTATVVAGLIGIAHWLADAPATAPAPVPAVAPHTGAGFADDAR